MDSSKNKPGAKTPNFKDDAKSKKGDASTTQDEENQDVYFIIPRTVHILYGPYMYQGIMDYRTERLQGLKTFLEKLGVSVVLKPSPDHVNLARVWFLEEQMFSCKITSLIHGGDGELDPLCWEAAASVEKFIKKVLRGLRRTRQMGPEELKRPFCPCFHQGHGQQQAIENKSKSQTSAVAKKEEW